MNVSVIMATYNGNRYIYEQLLSIVKQTKKPDEIIIIDDASIDDTIKIVHKFVEGYPNIKWKVTKNSHNIGWKNNFFNLIKKAKGDLIFYCDQDDIWKLDRIEQSIKIFHENIGISCLLCNYDGIDEYGNYIDRSKKKDNYAIWKISYGDKSSHSALGCLLVFNTEVKDMLMQFIGEEYFSILPVDLAIARAACVLDGFYRVNLALVKHRFHQFNASNSIDVAGHIVGSNSLQNKKDYIYYDLKLMQLFSSYKGFNEKSCKYEKFLSARKNFINNGDCKSLIKELYHISLDYRLILILGDIAYFYGFNIFAGKVYSVLSKINTFWSY